MASSLLLWSAMAITPLFAQDQPVTITTKDTFNYLEDKKNINLKNQHTSDHSLISLNQILTYSYSHNKELLELRQGLIVACQDITAAKADFLPNISARYGVNKAKNITTPSIDMGSAGSRSTFNSGISSYVSTTREAAIQLKQNLFRFGGSLSSFKAAEKKIISAFYDYYGKQQGIFLKIIQTYIDIVYKSARVRHLESLKRANKESFDQSSEKMRVGSETITQVKNAELSYIDALTQLTTAQNDYNNALETMTNLTGGLRIHDFSKVHLDINLPESVGKAQVILEKFHPALLKARTDIDQSRQSKYEMQTRYAPSVDLNASVQRNESVGNTLSSSGTGYPNKQFGTNQTVGVTLSMSLYNCDLNAKTRKAIETVVQCRTTAQRAHNDLTTSLKISYESLGATKRNMTQLVDFVAAAKIALDATQSEMEAGSKVLLDVLNARQQLLKAELAHEDGIRQYWLAYANALSAIGYLDVNHLKLNISPVDLFDPFSILAETKRKF